MEGAATSRAWREACETGDVDALVALFAPDVVLRSPISARAIFRGPEELERLYRVLFGVMTDVRAVDDVGDERTRMVVFTSLVGGHPSEETVRLRLDDEGRIRELTIFVRPLAGLTALAAALGPSLAAASGRGRVRTALLSAMTRPLAALTRIGDRPSIALVKAPARGRAAAPPAYPPSRP